MKKKYFIFTLLLLLALFFCIPAMAATEYGVIYDETDELGSDTLNMQGKQTLPELSEKLGIDLRVDVLTQVSYDSMIDTAAGIYSRYDYGYGEEKEGATLTILMEPLPTGTYAMPANGWCVYANMSEDRCSSQALADVIQDAVEPSMAEQAWNGNDITMSAVALTQAVEDMAQAVEEYVLTNCPPNCPPNSSAPDSETFEILEENETSESDSFRMQYVFDISNLLSYEEWEELENQAADISKHQHCGVYFAMVDDYTDYGDSDIYELTSQIYHESQLGIGEERNGIIVLLSMEKRDYAMFVCGEYAEYAFDSFGQEMLAEYFLDDFGDNNWYSGISDYLDTCDEFLTKAEEGKPMRKSSWLMMAAAVGLSCLISGGICFFALYSMKSLCQKKDADAYIAEDKLYLTQQYDQYTHTTETRTKIQKSSSSSESGGGSGRRGKF